MIKDYTNIHELKITLRDISHRKRGIMSEWENCQATPNDRQENIHLVDNSRLRVGKNILTNRRYILNVEIKLDWLNLPFSSFKMKC